MGASGSIDPTTIVLDGSAVTVGVALYDRAKTQGHRYTFLPNVRCERIIHREGDVPPSAQFSYVLDTADPTSPFPRYVEDLWPLDASGPGVVTIGQELVVLALDENGDVFVLFDGFADAPQIDLTGRGQQVTFTASGVAIRCWDAPVPGALQRDATSYTGDPVPTELPARFNPDGKPNCTADGDDINSDDPTAAAYPIFSDWRLEQVARLSYWTLGKFTRYLLNTRPSGTQGDLAFVDNPKSAFLNGLDEDLKALKPVGGDEGPINTSDPSTYTTADIVIDDVVASDRPWPEVLATTLRRHGFAIRFETGQDATTPLPEPKTTLRIYRKDGLNQPAPKSLMLQPSGPLDPGRSNVAALHLVRDVRDTANQFRVVSQLARYEVSVVLAPGFRIDPADATNPTQFRTPALATASNDMRKKYRVYVADESGEGHWNFTSASWQVLNALDLESVFGRPANPGDPNRYVVRRRPGFDKLVAKDDEKQPYNAQLAISTNYSGGYPEIWDGTGTWQSLERHGWKMLRDRLGIEITTDNPNGWKLPDPPMGAPNVIADGVVRGVEAQANSAGQHFFLRLTCVIEGDWGVDAQAKKRVYAVGSFPIEQVVDARDVYRKEAVQASSFHFTSPGPTAWDHDDTAAAAAQARAYRGAREFPAIAGRAVVPWCTLAYQVGDRIQRVAGRGINLRVNAGADVGESPSYPVVVAVTHDFSGGKQETILDLSDHRAEPAQAVNLKDSKGNRL